MTVSLIIPAFNEENIIVETLRAVKERSAGSLNEIIVVDGGSEDRTASLAEKNGARVVSSPQRGRAIQMNCGASAARGEVLYFLHADSIPPQNFDRQILCTIDERGGAGCFRLQFDSDHPLLKFYGWCTRFDVDAFRFGDQSLFISRKDFEELGGFRDDHILMEDHEMVKRIKNHYPFRIVPEYVTTSSRKYHENGIIKLQLSFAIIFLLYQAGLSQSKLKNLYKNMIN